jgi:hypothetical protein
LLVALVVALWVGGYSPIPTGRPASVAALALAGLVIWSYASIAWAGDRGIAVTGANRTLAYLLVFVAVLQGRWSARAAAGFVTLAAAAIVCVGAGDVLHTAFSSHPATAFVDGRLSSPIAYANANAAMFAIAIWPLAYAAAARAVPVPVRAACAGLASVAFDLSLLGQSKGAAIGTGVAAAAYVLCAPRKLRALAPLLLVGAAALAVHSRLFAVYPALIDGGRGGSQAVHSATIALLVAAAMVAVVACTAAVLDRRTTVSAGETLIRVDRAVPALLVIAVVVLGLALLGNPIAAARDGWHAFKHPAQASSAGSHFASSAGNHRYDFWRVSANQFRASPVGGAGVENFGQDYVLTRRSSEEPLYPHSLEAQLLGQTGLVGFSLFALFALSCISFCTRATRDWGVDWAFVPVSSVAVFVYWLAHGSLDWLWEFPLLTGFAFASVAACLSTSPVRKMPARARSTRGVSVAVAAGLLVSTAILVPSWLAARETASAVGSWRTDPATADSSLRRAARLNPLDDEPYVVAATISERRRHWRAAAGMFRLAISRNPRNWYSAFGEGLALAANGRRSASLRFLSTAHRLNPREPIVTDVQQAVRAHRRVDADRVDERLVARAKMLVHF